MEAAIAVGGELVGNVIDWGWGALQDLWAEAPAIAAEALIDAGAATITDLTTGAIGTLINWVTGGIDDIAWIPDWTKYALNTFAGNIGEALGNIASGAINLARTGALDILGVTSAQERYMNNLQTSLNNTFDALITRIETTGEVSQQIGVQTVTAFQNALSRNVTTTFAEAEALYNASAVGTSGAMANVIAWAEKQLIAAQRGLAQSGTIAADMASRKLAGAYAYLTEISVGQSEKFMNDIQDNVIGPIATAQAYQWALSNIDPIEREALRESVIDMMIVQHEVAVEMLEQKVIVPKAP